MERERESAPLRKVKKWIIFFLSGERGSSVFVVFAEFRVDDSRLELCMKKGPRKRVWVVGTAANDCRKGRGLWARPQTIVEKDEGCGHGRKGSLKKKGGKKVVKKNGGSRHGGNGSMKKTGAVGTAAKGCQKAWGLWA